LGLNVRDAVYLRLLTKYSLTRDEIPKHLVTFQTMLEDSFGPRAAKVLSRAIARRLYLELHLAFVEHPAFGLPEYVEDANSMLLGKTQTTEKTNAAIATCKKSDRSEEKDCNWEQRLH